MDVCPPARWRRTCVAAALVDRGEQSAGVEDDHRRPKPFRRPSRVRRVTACCSRRGATAAGAGPRPRAASTALHGRYRPRFPPLRAAARSAPFQFIRKIHRRLLHAIHHTIRRTTPPCRIRADHESACGLYPLDWPACLPHTVSMHSAPRRAAIVLCALSLVPWVLQGLETAGARTTFAAQIEKLSEAEGAFDTDNLISNDAPTSKSSRR